MAGPPRPAAEARSVRRQASSRQEDNGCVVGSESPAVPSANQPSALRGAPPHQIVQLAALPKYFTRAGPPPSQRSSPSSECGRVRTHPGPASNRAPWPRPLPAMGSRQARPAFSLVDSRLATQHDLIACLLTSACCRRGTAANRRMISLLGGAAVVPQQKRDALYGQANQQLGWAPSFRALPAPPDLPFQAGFRHTRSCGSPLRVRCLAWPTPPKPQRVSNRSSELFCQNPSPLGQQLRSWVSSAPCG